MFPYEIRICVYIIIFSAHISMHERRIEKCLKKCPWRFTNKHAEISIFFYNLNFPIVVFFPWNHLRFPFRNFSYQKMIFFFSAINLSKDYHSIHLRYNRITLEFSTKSPFLTGFIARMRMTNGSQMMRFLVSIIVNWIFGCRELKEKTISMLYVFIHFSIKFAV